MSALDKAKYGCIAESFRGYHGGSPTAVQAWRPCSLWEPSHSHHSPQWRPRL